MPLSIYRPSHYAMQPVVLRFHNPMNINLHQDQKYCSKKQKCIDQNHDPCVFKAEGFHQATNDPAYKGQCNRDINVSNYRHILD